MEKKTFIANKPLAITFGILIFLSLYVTSLYNYLLFHTIAEMFSIAVALAVFMFVWNSRRYMETDYLVFIGIAFVFVAFLDLIHALAYKGMGVFQGYGANLPTQLWIAARYLQSISFLLATIFFKRNLRSRFIFGAYGITTTLLLSAIFYWDIFPVCYEKDVGLTLFKKSSEYIISLILIISLAFLFRYRDRFHSNVFRLIVVAIFLNIGAELAFTFYVSVYGLSNLIGHFLKILSFFLMYKAIIETGMVRPYNLLFRSLKKRETELEHYQNHLEKLVEERTSDLSASNKNLQEKMKELKKAEQRVRRRGRLLDAISQIFQEALVCETENEVGETCIKVAQELTGSAYGFIGELNQEGLFDTTSVSKMGRDACKIPDPDVMKMIKNMEIRGVDRSTIRDKRSRIVNDLSSHSDVVGVPNGHPPITSFLGVPLKQGDKTIGMIGLANKRSGYDEKDQAAVEALSIAAVVSLSHKKAEKALQESEMRHRLILENVSDVIFSIDRDFKVTSVSPSVATTLGYKPQELIGNPFQKLNILTSESFEVAKADTLRILAGERINAVEYEFIAKDGTKRFEEINAGPLWQDGEVRGVIFVARDITDKKRLEAQLFQSQKMEAIGRLAGGVAHDFNNLLTVITGYAEITLMKVDKDSSLIGDIEEIKKASKRAATLTNQLLAFSRKQMIQPVVLNINRAIAEMDKMLRRLIGEDVDLATILEPELWRVKFDPGQLDQVVMNLVVNAKDAMPKGGKLTIETVNVDLDEVYARQHGIKLKPGPFVVLAVSDTGMGIDEKTQFNIFEPFFTTKEKGKGTGLGLSTVYGIVKQNGGYIWIYSEPGQGTTFKIYLPKTEEEIAFAEEEQKQPKNLEGSETILLAEDDDSARKLIRSTLQEYGYWVLETQDGKEALQLVEHHKGPIHLLLTDVVMPGMSGRELAERLQPRQPKMKVLYMSGYTDNAIVHHGVLESGTPFIHKPFPPKALVSKVRKVLDT